MPDGSAVLVPDVDFATSRFVVHRVAVDGSGARPLFDGDFNEAWPHVKVSPDGQSVFFTRRKRMPSIDKSRLTLVLRSIASGEEQELYEAASFGAVGFFGLTVSPDGQFLAFTRNVGGNDSNQRTLDLVPASGGDARTLYTGTYTMPLPGTGGFTADGKSVLIAGRVAAAPASAPPVLWAVGVDGSAPRRVALEWRGGIRGAALSPDGRRLAFTGAETKGELWSITNLLGHATAANARR